MSTVVYDICESIKGAMSIADPLRKPEATLPSLPNIRDRQRNRYNDMWELGHIAWFGASVVTEDEFKQIEAYKASVKNVSLWVDEHILQTDFAAESPIDVGNGNFTGSFTIAVPNTNYPPGMAFSGYISSDSDRSANARHAYRYLVNVEHANGTIQSVPAGYTSFHPVLPMPSGPQEQIKIVSEFKKENFGCRREDCQQKPPACAAQNSNFTAHITLPSRTFKRGSNVTGSLRITSKGSEERITRVEQFVFVEQNRTWVRSMLPSFMNETEKETLANRHGFTVNQELYPRDDHFNDRWGRDFGTDVDPNQLTWTIPLSVSIDDDAVPTFNSSLTSFHSHVLIRIFSVFLCEYNQKEDDNEWEEYATHGWSSQRLSLTVPIAIVTTADSTISPVHYLTEGAKSPFFVPTNKLDEVSKMSAIQRNGMAPQARRQTVLNPPSQDTANRFSSPFNLWKEAYVGRIWRKKMSLRNKKEPNTLVFQSG